MGNSASSSESSSSVGDARSDVQQAPVKLFISSTFLDQIAERAVLHGVVGPRLRKYAQSRGSDVQLVDMRWGITDDDARERATAALCLQELRRAAITGPPALVVLLGHRNGWTPLPASVPERVFLAILARLPEGDAAGVPVRYLVASFFRRDGNASSGLGDTAEFVLRPGADWRAADVEALRTAESSGNGYEGVSESLAQSAAAAEPAWAAGRSGWAWEDYARRWMAWASSGGAALLPLPPVDHSITRQELDVGVLGVRHDYHLLPPQLAPPGVDEQTAHGARASSESEGADADAARDGPYGCPPLPHPASVVCLCRVVPDLPVKREGASVATASALAQLQRDGWVDVVEERAVPPLPPPDAAVNGPHNPASFAADRSTRLVIDPHAWAAMKQTRALLMGRRALEVDGVPDITAAATAGPPAELQTFVSAVTGDGAGGAANSDADGCISSANGYVYAVPFAELEAARKVFDLPDGSSGGGSDQASVGTAQVSADGDGLDLAGLPPWLQRFADEAHSRLYVLVKRRLDAQAAFARARTARATVAPLPAASSVAMHGRDAELDRVTSFLLSAAEAGEQNHGAHLLIVHGPLGAGKTTLLSAALERVAAAVAEGRAAAGADSAVITRSPIIIHADCAASARTGSLPGLVASLASDISDAYGSYEKGRLVADGGRAMPSTRYADIRTGFLQAAALATAERPLLLVIDGLDELPPFTAPLDDGTAGGRAAPSMTSASTALGGSIGGARSDSGRPLLTLDWLQHLMSPSLRFSHVRLVVSVRSGTPVHAQLQYVEEIFTAAADVAGSTSSPAVCSQAVGLLTPLEAANAIRTALAERHVDHLGRATPRTLTDEQMRAVIAQLTSAAQADGRPVVRGLRSAGTALAAVSPTMSASPAASAGTAADSPALAMSSPSVASGELERAGIVPLHVPLSLPLLARARSYDDPVTLAARLGGSVEECIRLRLDDWGRRHGEGLVAFIVASLSCARAGLTEHELYSALDNDEPTLRAVRARSFALWAATRSAPATVWARAMTDVRSLLHTHTVGGSASASAGGGRVYRASLDGLLPGTELLRLLHSEVICVVAEWAGPRIAGCAGSSAEGLRRVHACLARVFDAVQPFDHPRRLQNLPHHLIAAGKLRIAVELLTGGGSGGASSDDCSSDDCSSDDCSSDDDVGSSSGGSAQDDSSSQDDECSGGASEAAAAQRPFLAAKILVDSGALLHDTVADIAACHAAVVALSPQTRESAVWVRRLARSHADIADVALRHNVLLAFEAVRGNADALLALLSSHAVPTDLCDSRERSLLFVAAEENQLECLRVLLRCGARVDQEAPGGRFGGTGGGPLHVASRFGYIEVMRALLAAGADPNAHSAAGETPLMCATYRQCDAAARLLLRAGADANVSVSSTTDPCVITRGGPLLNVLIHAGMDDQALLLLRDGAADVMQTDREGRTALHVLAWAWGGAERRSREPLLRELLDRGASPNAIAEGGTGQAPIHMAAFCGHVDLLEVLLGRGRGSRSAEGAGSSDATDDGSSSSSSSGAEGPPAAAASPTPARVAADVNVCDSQGWSALHFTAMAGRAAAAQLLLTAGADANATENGGMTALRVACQRPSAANRGVVAALTGAGANASIADAQGVTPEAAVLRAAKAPDKLKLSFLALLQGGGAVLSPEAHALRAAAEGERQRKQAAPKPLNLALLVSDATGYLAPKRRSTRHQTSDSGIDNNETGPQRGFVIKPVSACGGGGGGDGRDVMKPRTISGMLQAVSAEGKGSTGSCSDADNKNEDASTRAERVPLPRATALESLQSQLAAGNQPAVGSGTLYSPRFECHLRALHVAAAAGDTSVVLRLLSAGAAVDQRTSREAEKLPVGGDELSDSGSDIDDEMLPESDDDDPFQYTALQLVVRELLRAGKTARLRDDDSSDNGDDQDDDNGVPVASAAVNADSGAARIEPPNKRGAILVLINAGADPSAAQGRRGEGPVHWAAEEGRIDVLALLCSAVSGSARREGGGEEFSARGNGTDSSSDGGASAVDEQGTSFNSGSAETDAAVPARGGGHAPATRTKCTAPSPQRLLLMSRDNYGGTALHVAARRADVALATFLVREHGCSVLAAQRDGWTPLHEAAAWGSEHGVENAVAVVQLLLAHGARAALALPAQGRNSSPGGTPLHSAAARNHVDVALALLAAGASPNAADDPSSPRQSPLHHALLLSLHDADAPSHNRRELLRALRVPPHIGPIGKGGRAGRLRIIHALLAAGADASQKDARGTTPLQLAHQLGWSEAVEALLQSREPA